MIRKYTAAISIVSVALLVLAFSCSRAAEPKAVSPDGASSARPAGKEQPASDRPPRPASAPAVRALPLDKFIGDRPLERIVPEDYFLGPLQDLSGDFSGESRPAAKAVRAFLDGLCEGRLSAAAPGARDILEFTLADLFSGKIRVIRWRMGAAAPRPEGGYVFPVLVGTGTGQARGEIFAGRSAEGEWGVELAALDLERLLLPATDGPGSFDPTIRTVTNIGR